MLSPALFSMYINTLIEELEPLTNYTMAFADDLAFVNTSIVELEKAIETVEKWCLRYGMQINKEKSGVMAVRLDKKTRSLERPSIR